jgi:hypothetical protein
MPSGYPSPRKGETGEAPVEPDDPTNSGFAELCPHMVVTVVPFRKIHGRRPWTNRGGHSSVLKS